MLMGWGPFRFTVPIYSVESLSRSAGARVESQMVIGSRPPTHLLGPAEETISLESTFHPYLLNKGGLAQLAGIRAATVAGIPNMLVHISGGVFGMWVCREINNEETIFAPGGAPQMVTASMTLVLYVGGLGF